MSPRSKTTRLRTGTVIVLGTFILALVALTDSAFYPAHTHAPAVATTPQP